MNNTANTANTLHKATGTVCRYMDEAGVEHLHHCTHVMVNVKDMERAIPRPTSQGGGLHVEGRCLATWEKVYATIGSAFHLTN